MSDLGNGFFKQQLDSRAQEEMRSVRLKSNMGLLFHNPQTFWVATDYLKDPEKEFYEVYKRFNWTKLYGAIVIGLVMLLMWSGVFYASITVFEELSFEYAAYAVTRFAGLGYVVMHQLIKEMSSGDQASWWHRYGYWKDKTEDE